MLGIAGDLQGRGRRREISRHCALRATVMLLALTGTACTASDATPQAVTPSGPVTDGLQLSLTSGNFIEASSMLNLFVELRNVSDSGISVNLSSATYDFEYEINGTWYAFDRVDTLPSPFGARVAFPDYSIRPPDLETIFPGTVRWTVLTVPFAGRSRALQLFAVTVDGPGSRFDPAFGDHVIRVRPARALEPARQAPVSNALTVSLNIPIPLDRSTQLMSFAASQDTLLREFQFVSGPPAGEGAIREVLARPPHPSRAHQLITAAALEVLKPISSYEFWVTGRNGLPRASLPTPTNRHIFMLRSSDQDLGFISLDFSPTGSVYNSFYSPEGNDDPILPVLQQLAQMAQVRGGNYEPRLVQVIGVRGASSFPVFWLHSSTGSPDLFYRQSNPKNRGFTSVESEKLYSAEEFLTAARTLPVAPRYNEAWATSIASVCARAAWPATSIPLNYEQPVVELGLRTSSNQEQRLGWYVHFPEREDAQRMRSKHSGATFFVDEASGGCEAVWQGE